MKIWSRDWQEWAELLASTLSSQLSAPDRTVVTGLIKSNLPMKVCLRVANATNSQIVLGEAGAESLLGKGDLLCDLGRGITRAQSYYLPQSDFVGALRA